MTPELRRYTMDSGAKPLAWLAGITAAVIAVAFAITNLLPDSINILRSEVGIGLTTTATDLSDPIHVALGAMTAMVMVNFIVAIVSAAEFRSYLGAGITRRDTFAIAQIGIFAVAVVTTIIVALALAVAALLGGSMTFTADSLPVPAAMGLAFLTYIAAAEAGYLISALFVRFRWYVGVATALIALAITTVADVDQSAISIGSVRLTSPILTDHPYLLAAVAEIVAAAIAAAIAYATIRALPMIRN